MIDPADWVGRSSAETDLIVPAPLVRLAALFDQAVETVEQVPLLGHWLFFLPHAVQSRIGGDGHPKLGGELPDAGLPRRMWAGGRLRFLAPLPVGVAATRTTTISDVRFKQGRSGDLLFVTLLHEIVGDGVPCIREEQDLVYRAAWDPADGITPEPAGIAPTLPVAHTRTFDIVQLFRYSALTFNGHRIHYDRDHARDREGYRGLVVHGPLLATLLLDTFVRANPGAEVKGFTFRGMHPVFDGEPVDFCMEGTGLEAHTAAGPCMRATVEV